MSKVSKEELEKALRYLDEFEKGNAPFVEKEEEEVEEKKAPEKEDVVTEDVEKGQVENDDDDLKNYHEQEFDKCIKKAQFHKSIIDKIKKGEALPDEAFDCYAANGGQVQVMQKGQGEDIVNLDVHEPNVGDIEELYKGKIADLEKAYQEKFDALQKSFDEKIEKINDEPVRKTVIKGADTLALKKALSNEPDEDGKKILSATLQKSEVSKELYECFCAETNELEKGRIGDAIAAYESTGYLDPSVARTMYEHGVKIIK